MIGGINLKQSLGYIANGFKKIIEAFSFLLVVCLIGELILFMTVEIVKFVVNSFFRLRRRITATSYLK